MWYIHTKEYYSAIKKNEIISFSAIWMQLEIIILSQGSQKEKDKYCGPSTYMWNLKYSTNEPIYKSKINSQTQRTDVVAKGEREESGREFGVFRRKLLRSEWADNKFCCIAQGAIANLLG